MSAQPRSLVLAALVFAAAWLVYESTIPLVLRTWNVTGDEPHYLLAAHSLVYDGDLDLANNYANGDYAAFYPAGDLGPHVKVQPNGAQLPSHDVGLPVMMALPYALGGRAGVMQFFAALGALLAAQMALLGYEVSRRWWAGAVGGLMLALTAPLGLYVFQIYPEMASGLLVIWALRQVLGTPGWLADDALALRGSGLKVILVAVALAALPWLSGRYAPLLVFIVALAAWKQWPRPAAWPVAAGVALVSLTAYLAVNYALYGGPTPSATPGGSAVASGFTDVSPQQIGRGLMGWWLDQHRGLLIFGPQLILALVGLPHLWRLRGADGLMLVAPVAMLWLLASAWGGFYSAWEVSARYLIVGLPPMAGSLAAAVGEIGGGWAGRWQRRLFWPLAAVFVTLGAANAAIMILDPFVMFHESPVAFWEEATGYRLREYFPAAGTRYIALPPRGAAEWRAPQGQAGYLHRSAAIAELSIGWYVLYGQAQLVGGADPDAAAVTISAFSSEAGLPLFDASFRLRDANPATGLVNVRVPFFNPYVDRWDFPFYLDVWTTGTAEVRLSRLLFEPDPLPTLGIAALWVAGLAALTAVFGRETKRTAPS